MIQTKTSYVTPAGPASAKAFILCRTKINDLSEQKFKASLMHLLSITLFPEPVSK